MKIGHIAYTDSGGASIAAYRLHLSLLEAGLNSKFLVCRRSRGWDGVEEMKRTEQSVSKINSFAEKLMRKLIAATGGRKSPIQMQWVDKGYLDSIADDFDIIHLHWVDASVASIFEVAKLRKPIVWTLHDMRAFTSGYHYEGYIPHNVAKNHYDMHKMRRNWAASFNRILKKKLYKNKNISIIAPSRWMYDSVKDYGTFSGSRISYIPYGIPETISNIPDRREARNELNIKPSQKIILFGAENVTDMRKGGDLLLEAVIYLEKNHLLNEDFIFYSFGSESIRLPDSLQHSHRHLGRINNEMEMNRLFSAADVFVAPSREDNLPNVVLESMRCGTPVVAFNTGGMADMIHDDETGKIVPPFDTSLLAEAIHELSILSGEEQSVMRELCKKNITERFSIAKQLSSVMDVYQKSMNSNAV